jgi:ribulose-5-phosphate 4-epimerase/fuculose-1-phosphate aldolase
MLISESTDARVELAIDDLVLANRILTVESVFDAYGHVSVRHPLRADRFLMSEDSPPVLVRSGQMCEYNLDGELAIEGSQPSYMERYIHASVYAARPDIHAICHNHTVAILPFCACPTVSLEIISHTASTLGGAPPVWDISDEFGGETNLMVTDRVRGDSMARTLGDGAAVLMRSHGSTVVGRNLREVVVRTHELVRNARAYLDALSLGAPVVPVAPMELERNATLSAGGSYARQWRYYQWRLAQHNL